MTKYTERKASQKRVAARRAYDEATHALKLAEAELRLAEAEETLARVSRSDETRSAYEQVVAEKQAAVDRLRGEA